MSARVQSVDWLNGRIDELERREIELQARSVHVEAEWLKIFNQHTARVKTLEDALRDASSVAEDFRRVIVQVYPDATRQDNPYYTIRNHMAAMLRMLDMQALAAKEPK